MSMIEDMRKVLQDFLAPELRAVSARMDGLEKQRTEDKSDILRAISDLSAHIDKQRVEDKGDLMRSIAEGNAHMEKRFELVIDYTKVLQRMDRLEESRQAEQH